MSDPISSSNNTTDPSDTSDAGTARQAELHRELVASIRTGFVAQVKETLEKGADVNWTGNSGYTALMEAAFRGWPDIMDLLLQRGARSDAIDSAGLTALHYLFRIEQAADPQCVRLLVSHGADVNAKEYGGCTPLWCALDNASITREDNSAAIQALLDVGADACIPGENWQTPLDVFRRLKKEGLEYRIGKSLARRLDALDERARMDQDTPQAPRVSRPSSRM